MQIGRNDEELIAVRTSLNRAISLKSSSKRANVNLEVKSGDVLTKGEDEEATFTSGLLYRIIAPFCRLYEAIGFG
jgi:hypothetical protein